MNEDKELKVKASYAIGKEKCHTGEEIGEGRRFFPGWLYDKDDDFVQAVYSKLIEKGFTPEITQYNFCNNELIILGAANIKTFGLGPSKENLAHTLNEYIRN